MRTNRCRPTSFKRPKIPQESIVGKTKPTIAIAGATGFIGSRLCDVLSSDFDIVALTRRPRTNTNGITWRKCDLYNLESCVEMLSGVQAAVYLVHSMMPSARMTQARFEDLDLILADNFARAAQSNGIQHVVYVGGLDPETPDTSVHLSSRMEVEQVLAQRIPTVTALRAGLVIGSGGSSYEVLKDVVQKLPVILCPNWTTSKMQPIGLEDLIVLIRQSLLEKGPSGCHDIGSTEIMTYRQLMERAASQMSISRQFIYSPIGNTLVSSLAVQVLTGKPISLIKPLLESLKHDMVAKNTDFQNRVLPQTMTFEESFSRASIQAIPSTTSPVERIEEVQTLRQASAVRSVQRMTIPNGKDAFWLAKEYLRWLPKAFQLLIKAEYIEERISRMYLQGTSLLLLELTFQPTRSSSNRAVYTISDGLLVRNGTEDKGTFEFRLMLDSPVLLTAIHDFHPQLPWYLYTISQAKVHQIVMYRFAKYLRSLST